MIKIGHGSTATDNLVLIDLGGMSSAATVDTALYMGGFKLHQQGVKGNAGVIIGAGTPTWTSFIRGSESLDTNRRDHVLYEAPTIAGFTLQAAVAEDNYWDVALRYAGEFAGFRIAFGVGYREDTKFNGATGVVTCTTDCDRKDSDVLASASVLHVPTGLFVTAAGDWRESKNATSNAFGGTDANTWWLAGGVRKNFFGFGDTVLFGEYGVASDYGRGTSFSYAPFFGNVTLSSSEVNWWGIGINQYIDAAAMEVFATYKSYDIDLRDLNNVKGPFEGFQAVIAGMRINF
jgi:hypothetical protein